MPGDGARDQAVHDQAADPDDENRQGKAAQERAVVVGMIERVLPEKVGRHARRSAP